MTAVNNDDKEAELVIPLPMEASSLHDLETGEELKAEGGRVRILLPEGGSILIGVNTSPKAE